MGDPGQLRLQLIPWGNNPGYGYEEALLFYTVNNRSGEDVENARKEQEKPAGRKEETKVSKKMLRIG